MCNAWARQSSQTVKICRSRQRLILQTQLRSLRNHDGDAEDNILTTSIKK